MYWNVVYLYVFVYMLSMYDTFITIFIWLNVSYRVYNTHKAIYKFETLLHERADINVKRNWSYYAMKAEINSHMCTLETQNVSGTVTLYIKWKQRSKTKNT